MTEEIEPKRRQRGKATTAPVGAPVTGETAGIGHNQPPEDDKTYRVAAAELRSFVERIERLEEEKATIGSDIKDVYTETKLKGYDARTIREIIRLRKQDPDEVAEREAVLDTYKSALGMGSGQSADD